MKTDPHQGRFMSYLSLFTFFMLLLVCADNFILLFLGWEGIGLSSFLLIGFWGNRVRAGQSAIKAMLINRVGDLCLLVGVCAIFLTFKSLDYAVAFALTPCAIIDQFSFLYMGSVGRLTLITLFFLMGVLGKSAQLGLHTWLPDAMEGPTPVSALIHAATLVTAGVFLLVRCSYLFEYASISLCFVTLAGSATAFFSSSVGLIQNDIKRVIAYSTASQVGYMVFACGLSNYSLSVFHLANHAFFKAVLFLGAGSVIHGLSDEQDLRKMGGLIKAFPITNLVIFLGSIALAGLPFLTGFYSKDVILEIAFSSYNALALLSFSLGCLAASFTAFYSGRLFFLTFLNSPNSYLKYSQKAHEPKLLMLVPLIFLCALSVIVGYNFKEMFVGLGSPFFQSATFVFTKSANLEAEFLSAAVKNFPFLLTLLGLIFSYTIIYCSSTRKKDFLTSILKLKLSTATLALYRFLSKKWHFDQLINEFVAHGVMTFGHKISFRVIDKGFIEKYSVLGSSQTFVTLSERATTIQSGFLSNYLLMLLLPVLLLTLLLYSCTLLISFMKCSFLLLNYFLSASRSA